MITIAQVRPLIDWTFRGVIITRSDDFENAFDVIRVTLDSDANVIDGSD
jgi:hypothetical protein